MDEVCKNYQKKNSCKEKEISEGWACYFAYHLMNNLIEEPNIANRELIKSLHEIEYAELRTRQDIYGEGFRDFSRFRMDAAKRVIKII